MAQVEQLDPSATPPRTSYPAVRAALQDGDISYVLADSTSTVLPIPSSAGVGEIFINDSSNC